MSTTKAKAQKKPNAVKEFMRKMQENHPTLVEPYEDMDRHPDMSLVRLVRYEEPKPKVTGPIKSLLMQDENGNFVEKEKAGIGVRIMPTVLILKAGESALKKGIEDAQLRMVPADMVVGMARNPDFVDVHEAHIKQGVTVRSNIPEMLPASTVFWGRYRFVNPFSPLEKNLSLEDMYTFLIPSSFILNKISV